MLLKNTADTIYPVYDFLSEKKQKLNNSDKKHGNIPL